MKTIREALAENESAVATVVVKVAGEIGGIAVEHDTTRAKPFQVIRYFLTDAGPRPRGIYSADSLEEAKSVLSVKLADFGTKEVKVGKWSDE